MNQHASHQPILPAPSLVELLVVVAVFGLLVLAGGAALRYGLI